MAEKRVSVRLAAVVLDTALASLPIAEADLGLPWNWRIGPASRAVSDETYVAQAFMPEGIGLRPFSVAHVEQPWRRPRAPGDLTIRWTRRCPMPRSAQKAWVPMAARGRPALPARSSWRSFASAPRPAIVDFLIEQGGLQPGPG